ncbi:unnamed protein product [Didymodactylos carnosus]|uniref:EF-hand domain-containing protein n=1 Tax=Didymodactylos carnosus TaxID=1234261 RepID=A0A814GV62_9BILA|nr:unnamed protein product [Didymodactylos carnosus]CAF3773195.1 unnamed protein product [Didymodactylos carnosus]
MATLTTSFTDVRRHRPLHHMPHQRSIMPLRRERTIASYDNPLYSSGLSANASMNNMFSGEKHYTRRQSRARSAKSNEIFSMINHKLQTGLRGVRQMFRSNDPSCRLGHLSKEAFHRVLIQLCGFISTDEWNKVCKMFHLNERGNTITFEEFLSYFPENEKAKRELALSQTERNVTELVSLNKNINDQHKRFLPKLTATYCLSLMRNKCKEPSFNPIDYIPKECLHGIILPYHLKMILEKFQLDDLLLNNNDEFQKLWSKFDLDNIGHVKTNVLLRMLDYKPNLADEIDRDIRRLLSRSCVIDKTTTTLHRNRSPRSSHTRRNNSSRENSTPPPSVIDHSSPRTRQKHDHNESMEIKPDNETSIRKENKSEPSPRLLSTKFRMIVQKHRNLTKQLNSNDQFLPYLDRKVNEGYFCLKTVFDYLDSDKTGFVTKQLFIAALNEFDIPISHENLDRFLQKHHYLTNKNNMVDYNIILKYFQDRSGSSFLAQTINSFSSQQSIMKSEFSYIENGLIDLMHRIFLSLTAAFKYLSNDSNDLCAEKEFYTIIKKELNINENYSFTNKQKNEICSVLDWHIEMTQIPYKRFLHYLAKSVELTNQIFDKHFIEKSIPPRSEHSEEMNSVKSQRKLVYIEKILNDLVRLRIHTLTKAFAQIDQPRTEMINKEQFLFLLKKMSTDLTKAEVDMIWIASGFDPNKSIPFSNLIRQLVMFNGIDEQKIVNKEKHSNSLQSRLLSTVTTHSISSSTTVSMSDIDYYAIYDRIVPHIRLHWDGIKQDLIQNDENCTGLIYFSALLDIFQRYSIPITEKELGALVRKDNPDNSSKIHYPFFIKKYRPNAKESKNKSPWSIVHPIYDQLINRYHMKNSKELYEQRIQDPKDLRYLIRLFISYDTNKKGYLTSEEFHRLLTDNDIQLSSTDEVYYQLFSVHDKKLKDQFSYKDLFRTFIETIMSY